MRPIDNMFNLIITLDYELPAGGQGDVRKNMIEPTTALLNACESYGAKLTIMVEMGELWAFEKKENAEFKEHLGYDPSVEIRRQLAEAIQRGHDVQLHLHPQWVNARWNTNKWDLDYSHYKITDFDDEKMPRLLRQGKDDLETLLVPCCAEYECVGFRAGHWNTHPSDRYLKALLKSGLKSDTSVFKGGYVNDGVVKYDYRNAYSSVLAWHAQASDINQPSSENGIIEVPIASEMTRIANMLTPKRLWLARKYFSENKQISDEFCNVNSKKNNLQRKFQNPVSKIGKLFQMHSKKLDFCKLTANEMVSMVGNLVTQFKGQDGSLPIPLVMIGHSKEIQNGKGLGKFLKMTRKQFGDEIKFATYRDFVKEFETKTENIIEKKSIHF